MMYVLPGKPYTKTVAVFRAFCGNVYGNSQLMLTTFGTLE